MYNESKNSYRPRGVAVGRRVFLFGAAITGTLGAFGVLSSRGLVSQALAAGTQAEGTSSAVAGDALSQFMRVSAFVTGNKPLNATSGKRFLAALTKRDAAFATSVATLSAYIEKGTLPNMDAFLATASGAGTSGAPDAAWQAMRETATQIVSAWYLGIVGDGADSELITYADALMYVPTKGILAVPTYGPGPLAWGPKPIGPAALTSSGAQAVMTARMAAVTATSHV
ncbi:sugar dehydrogenase complex small subunit [Robbsia sp. KACC 23696]|uniref:sugar dehydrogenase complex small subunit n=1 Tax=Robbsia sp. KACC 23696 TaxID=3149231 RepID=UPI00325B4F2D